MTESGKCWRVVLILAVLLGGLNVGGSCVGFDRERYS